MIVCSALTLKGKREDEGTVSPKQKQNKIQFKIIFGTLMGLV